MQVSKPALFVGCRYGSKTQWLVCCMLQVLLQHPAVTAAVAALLMPLLPNVG